MIWSTERKKWKQGHKKALVSEQVDKFTCIMNEDEVERLNWVFKKAYIEPMIDILRRSQARKKFWDILLQDRGKD